MGRSPGFGSTAYNFLALFRLGFPAASDLRPLTLLHTVTRRLINQKAHHYHLSMTVIVCKHMVSNSLSLPSQGFFSPFPHGTGSLSVAGTYLALGDGPPGFPQGSSCPAVLRSQTREPLSFRLRGLHPVSPTIPDHSAKRSVSYSPASPCRRPVRPCNTAGTTLTGLTYQRFGLFPVRSPLLRESRLLSLPPGTEMVHFPGLAPRGLWIQPRGDWA